MLNVTGRIVIEIGTSAGERRCTTLHFFADDYFSKQIQEFELGLSPVDFYPQLSFGLNTPAWLFLIESTSKKR